MNTAIVKILLCLFLCSLSTADAGLVSVTGNYQLVDTGYRYYFTVQNTTDPLPNLHVGSFNVWPDSGPYSTVDSPPGWYAVLTPYTVFWSSGISPIWYDGIPPGQTLSGFNFTSPQLVTSMTYHVWMSNGTDVDGEVAEVSITPIPEPSSLLALGLGGLGILGTALRRRLGATG
jgi:hypothetical protein